MQPASLYSTSNIAVDSLKGTQVLRALPRPIGRVENRTAGLDMGAGSGEVPRSSLVPAYHLDEDRIYCGQSLLGSQEVSAVCIGLKRSNYTAIKSQHHEASAVSGVRGVGWRCLSSSSTRINTTNTTWTTQNRGKSGSEARGMHHLVDLSDQRFRTMEVLALNVHPSKEWVSDNIFTTFHL
jgi:hypothetical protein